MTLIRLSSTFIFDAFIFVLAVFGHGRLRLVDSNSWNGKPSTSTSTSTSTRILDLSYKNELTNEIISSRLHQFLHNKLQSMPNHSIVDIVVDISQTNVDNGTILQSLNLSYFTDSTAATINANTTTSTNNIDSTITNKDPYTNTTRVGIDLIAHCNRLTSYQVGVFLNQLCNDNNHIHESPTTITASSTATNNSSNSRSSSTIPKFFLFWKRLDFGWNLLQNSAATSITTTKSSLSIQRHDKNFNKALQKVIGDRAYDIQSLSLCCCGLGPATCRAIAKGLLHRYETVDNECNQNNIIRVHPSSTFSLDLSYNQDIGDSGAAAIAAAIRCIGEVHEPILETLDMSACNIGDVGVEALTLALEDAIVPVMISNLKLCHNLITDKGALALGHIFHRNINGTDLHLDLSNNPRITDRGITSLLSAVDKGCVSKLVLRSCSIQADGAELVGRMLRSIASNSYWNGRTIEIDLSGNPIGILRGKSDKNNLKESAGATASAYVSQGLSFLKKGFVSVGGTFVSSESDEDEDSNQAFDSYEKSDKTTNLRCGFKSLANAFIGTGDDDDNNNDVPDNINELRKTVCIGLRRTFCDTAGADALAAMIVTTKDKYKDMEIRFELDLNPMIEEQNIGALNGQDDDVLVEMAERHNEAMDIIRQANERAIVAAKVLASRRQKHDITSSSHFETYEDEEDGFDVYEHYDDGNVEYNDEQRDDEEY